MVSKVLFVFYIYGPALSAVGTWFTHGQPSLNESNVDL